MAAEIVELNNDFETNLQKAEAIFYESEALSDDLTAINKRAEAKMLEFEDYLKKNNQKLKLRTQLIQEQSIKPESETITSDSDWLKHKKSPVAQWEKET